MKTNLHSKFHIQPRCQKRSRHLLAGLIPALWLCLAPAAALANGSADYLVKPASFSGFAPTWTGNFWSTTSETSTAGAWSNSGEQLTIGSSGSDATWAGQTFSINLNASDNMSGVLIQGAYTGSGNNLNVTLSGTSNARGHTSGTGTWTVPAGATLVLTTTANNSGFNFNSVPLTFQGGGTIEFNDTFLANGGGQTYTETMSGGTIELNQSATSNFGGTAGAAFVLNTGALNFMSTAALADTFAGVTVAEGVQLGWGTPDNNPTIDNLSGSAGTITLGTGGTYAFSGDFTYVGSANNLSLGNNAVVLTGSGRTITVNNNTLTVGGVISGSGDGITKAGNGTLTLGGANTYSGNTTINAGTLLLNASGSVADSPQISIASGATFDVSAAGITLTGSSPQQTLAASSTSGGAAINAPSQTVTLSSGVLLSFQAAGSGPETVGKIDVTGNLTLNANAVTVNVTGSALATGTYRLLDCTGTLNNSGSFGTPTITGTPLASGFTASISVTPGSGGHLDLVVIPPAVLTIFPPASASSPAISRYGSTSFSVSLLNGTAPYTVTVDYSLLEGQPANTDVQTLAGSGLGPYTGPSVTPVSTIATGIYSLPVSVTDSTTPTPQTASGSISVTVTGASLTWNGDSGNVNDWDTTLPVEWQGGETYNQGDFVTFNDTASGGSTPGTVNLDAASPQLAPGSLTVNNTSGGIPTYTFTGSGSISGATSLVKTGTGTLLLQESGGDSFNLGITANGGKVIIDNNSSGINGGTTIGASGTVQVGNNDTTGVLPTGAVTDNGSLVLDRSDNNGLNVANTISGSGTVTINGSGVVTLSGANTYSGQTTIASGSTLDISADNNLGANPVSSTANQLQITGGTLDTAGITVGSNRGITLDNTLGGTIEVDTGSATIANTLKGGTLTKTGSGGLIVENAGDTFAGANVNVGTLRCNTSAAALGTGPITVQNGAELYLDATTAYGNSSYDISGFGVVEADTVSHLGAIRFANAGGSISSTVTLTGDAGISPRSTAATGATISGQITGNYNIRLGRVTTTTGTSAGKLILSSTANNWGGNTTNEDGWLQCGAAGVIPSGAAAGNFIMATPGTAFFGGMPNTVFDLNGYNQTVNGLSDGVVDYYGTPLSAAELALLVITNNSSATAATLTVGNNNASGSYGGVIVGGNSLGLTKIGGGTETLSGANTYTGNTVISAGTLALSGSGSLAGSPNIFIASGAMFDVSAAGITLTGASPVQTLAGSSTSGAATINAPAQTVTMSSGALLSFQAVGGASTTVGQISVTDATSALTLSGNTVTVNVTGSALATGTYRLISCAGTVTGTANPTATITGTPLTIGYSATVSTTTGSAGHVDLVVTPPVGVTIVSATASSPSISRYGNTSFSVSLLDGTAPYTVTVDYSLLEGVAPGTDIQTLTGSGTGPFTGALVTPASTIATGVYSLPVSVTDSTTPTPGTASGSISVTVTGASLTWNGDSGNVNDWDTAGELEWQGNEAFNQGDLVTFNDTASGGSTPGTVNLVPTLSPGSLTVNNTLGGIPTYTFTGGGQISGAISLIKQGTGTLRLQENGGDNFSLGITANGGTVIVDNDSSGINGGTTIGASGTVQVGNNDSTGVLPTGAVTNNGSLVLDRSDNNGLNVANIISGSGTVTVNGSGTVTLSGANSYSGKTTIASGSTLDISAANNLGANPVAFTANQLQITGGTLDFGSSTPTLNTNAGITLDTTLGGTVELDSGSLTIGNVIAGGTLTKTGSGGVILTNSLNTFVGANVNAGTLRINTSAAALGTGPITVANGATLYLDVGSAYGNSAYDISGYGVAESDGVSHLGAIRFAVAGASISSTITLTGDAGISPRNTGATGATISGQITGNYNLRLGRVGVQGGTEAGTLILSNPANNWGGNTTNEDGVLQMGAAGVIPSGAAAGNFIMSTPGAAYATSGYITNTVFDLHGFNQTVNGLSSDPSVTGSDLNLLQITNSSATAATLTVGNNNASGSYAGLIDGGNSLGLAKIGGGTETLSGANTYTGNTTINAGTLALSGSGSIANSPNLNLAAGATFDVSGTTSGNLTLTGASPVQTLAGSSTSGAATINAPAGTVTLAPDALLSFSAAGGVSTTAGKISVTGNLTLNNNVVTVNVTGGQLAAGTYPLMSCSGTLTGSANPAPTIIPGSALGSGFTATVDPAGGEVNLIVVQSGPGVFTNPTSITNFALVNGTNVMLSGTNGQSGDAYYLLQSANLALPLNQWMAVGTDVLSANGAYTITFTNVVTPGVPQQFFRLSSTNFISP